ncbi:hypothetical protein BD560DRAFT_336712, partial [Blakeslea trispora]
SAPHARYHEPIRGVGFRRLLKEKGFKMYLIDEYCTSRCCPDYQDISLATSLNVPNSRQRPNPPSELY